jgi:hypothetical protein
VPTILRRLPSFSRPTTYQFQGRSVGIYSSLIVISVSLGPPIQKWLHLNALRFPAILDTGYNGTFLLREEHLTLWAGFRLANFDLVRGLAVSGRYAPVYDAGLWIHPNEPGERTEAARASPVRIPIDPGMTVSSNTARSSQLPLLGLRALALSNLLLSVDCRRLTASLRPPRRFPFFS